MPLTAGTRLGPYEVGPALGTGGMGEVYRARDTRLDRTVAIKVLPASALGATSDARARLNREARTLSQLSHPHVCTLHDVGNQDGIDYLVMELVEGETLADRLKRGPLPLADVLALGGQVAAALDAAHRLGIVHRDLKPGNVMLTRTGVKVLDFGLAKAFTPPPVASAGDLTTAAVAGLTTEGTIVGTPPYMAPEQFEGRTVDARADVFAFGAVLFEMATGQRAFAGESSAAVMSSIMTVDPPAVSSVRPGVPPALDHIVRTCLAKDPEERWQSMRDVAGFLVSAGNATPEAPATPSRSRVARALPWLVAAVAAGASVVPWFLTRPATNNALPSVISFGMSPPDDHTFFTSFESIEMAVSPDGTRVAFVASDQQGRRSLWIRALAETTATAVADTDGAVSAFWSPDGRSLGVFAGDVLMRINLDGSAPVRLSSLPSSNGFGGSWGADGEIVFAGVLGEAIFRTSTSGSAPVILVEPDAARRETRVRWPWFLPDGRRFLYMAEHDDGTGRLMLWSPEAAPREIMAGASNVAFVNPGFVVYAEDGALLARPFDPEAGQVSGEAVAIAERVNHFRMTAVAHYAASPNGVLAYQAAPDLAHVAWFDRQGRETGIAASGGYLSLRLSPDNRELLFDRIEPSTGSYDEWLLDVNRGVETRLTADPGNEVGGAWAPDGGLFYSAGPNGPPLLVYRSGAGSVTPVEVGTGLQSAHDVSPDGAWLTYSERRPDGSQTLKLLSLGGDAPWSATTFIDSPFSLSGGRFSPDGRWLAFTSNESGRYDVYVSPFPATGRTTRISTSGGRLPRWRHDGRELIYLSDDGALMAMPMTGGQPGVPASLFRMAEGATWTDFDVAADGRFIAIVPESFVNRRPMTVIVNWPERFR